MNKIKKKCILCNNSNLIIIHNFGRQPPSNSYKIRKTKKDYLHELILTKCSKCSLVQISNPIPIKRVVPNYKWISYREQESHLNKIVNIIRIILKKDQKILGISSKDSTFLERLKSKGYNKTKELNKKKDYILQSDLASLESIQKIFNFKFTENLIKKNGNYDLLVCRHFLEHSRNPLQLMNNFKNIINESGYILIEVPDNVKIFKKSNYFFIWEEHMSYFTNNTLENLFKLSNLKIFYKFKFKYSHEDSLVYILSKKKTNKKIILKKDKNYKNIFNKKILTFHKNISNFNNKRIVILGAGHVAIRFINFYELSNLIEFVVDDHKNKIGKYLPKSNLQIKSSKELYKTPVDLCISTLNDESEKQFKKNNFSLFQSGLKIINIFK